ncbi:MAG: 16S rRNA (guanine(966)-N(2))-methyltransferase RsmD [Candidatus Rokuibacteriota bacterium]|nr:MAG: 16S rRNA (guanine(966)-N(2))-methyltransferase RsmD [Candidatus Rokubacteria bacterium]PYN68714.1 MAG: 16S rRNA (guanine(966)-N(2))-methyltransferase RsmD [Candidatus Rokubacteria bacterium]
MQRTAPCARASWPGGVASSRSRARAEGRVRVIAGALKGRRLVTPRGTSTRPTADQIRVALMDTLTPWLSDARVLDLFAGAGGVGLEALSRGALHATFVEREARAVAALDANIRSLGVEAQARVLRLDAGRALRRLAADGTRFGIVFLDPPYATDLAARTLQALGAGGVAATGAIVVAQHLTKRAPASDVGVLKAFRTRRFGETTLTFFRAEG